VNSTSVNISSDNGVLETVPGSGFTELVVSNAGDPWYYAITSLSFTSDAAPPVATVPTTINVEALVLASSSPPLDSLTLGTLDFSSSPAPPPSTGSTSGGTTGSVTTLDTGGTLFSSIAPGSGGGKPSEPIDDVVPIHPAPYKVPPPPTSDEAIGGFGSRLFQSHFTPIQHFGVSGIDTPAPSGGNPSLWY
jgi:hypothetical protein